MIHCTVAVVCAEVAKWFEAQRMCVADHTQTPRRAIAANAPSQRSERGDARLALGGSEARRCPLIGSQYSAAALGRGARLRAQFPLHLWLTVTISVAGQTNRLSIIDAN